MNDRIQIDPRKLLGIRITAIGQPGAARTEDPRVGDKTGGKPGVSPDIRLDSKVGSKPGNKPNLRIDSKVGTKTGNKPGQAR